MGMDGYELERISINALKRKYEITSTIQTITDVFEGTDFFVKFKGRSFRVDITGDFHSKEVCGKMEQIGQSEHIQDGLFLHTKYGWRTHNGTNFLPEPVLVIGVYNPTMDLQKQKDWAIKAYEAIIGDVLLEGLQQYVEHEYLPQIEQDPFVIGESKIQTKIMQEKAIFTADKEDIPDLAFELADPDTYVQQLAVQKNGLAIEAFIAPTSQTQKYAVMENAEAIDYIENPDFFALLSEPEIEQTEKMQRRALEMTSEEDIPNLVALFKNPSEEIQKEAISKNELSATVFATEKEQSEKADVDEKNDKISQIINDETLGLNEILNKLTDVMQTNVQDNIGKQTQNLEPTR